MMKKNYSVKKIVEFAENDQDFIVLVVRTFLKEIPPDLKAMLDAINNGNRDLAYHFAHKIKPNFEMFELNLNKSMVAIESWTKSKKNKSTIREHMDLVVVKIEMVLKELKENYSL